MKPTWKSEWPVVAVLALVAAFTAWAWPRVPARMPVHFGLDGTPDRWGGRAEGLLVLPLAALALYALFAVLPLFDPGRVNYPRFADAYRTVRLATIGFVAALQVALLDAVLGGHVEGNRLAFPLVGVLLVVLGNLMGKLRPNWFIGIRTPWTLSSKRAWDRTHRAGGWVFIACGLLFLLAGFLRQPRATSLAFGVLVAGVLALAAYSWRVWANDPDKVPPAGTQPAEDGEPRP